MKFVDIYSALYDYNSQHEEELTFKADDTLYILENDDSDWYKAQLKPKSAEEDGPIGLVPANYVKRAESIGSVAALYTYTALAEEELSFNEDDIMTLYEKDDPNWFLAEKNGAFGLVPSNYVEEITNNTTTTASAAVAAIPAEESSVASSDEEEHVEPEKSRSIHNNNDEALSWSVHEFDVAKKKKTKAKGNLLVGNGMLCYGSETDKASPVRQFNISQVAHAVVDSKHVHIELTGNQMLDFQATSKSEAKSIVTKIESSKLATASQSSSSFAAPSLASDQQSDISASYHSPAASFQSLPQPQNQQQSEHPRAHSPLPPVPVEPQPQPPLCEAKWAIALYPFISECDEETSLEQHEQVLVTDYVGSNDWWMIEHKDGKNGIVPASYVQFQDEYETQQAKEEEGEEELKRKKQQEEQIARSQREEKQREEQQQKLQEDQRYQEEERKRKQQQDEILKKQMEEQERRRQQEEKEKARQIEAERRRKMQEEAKQKELDAKKMANLAASAAVATVSPQLGNSSPRRSQIPAPLPPPVVKPPVAAAPVHNDPTKPDLSKLRTWTDNTGAFKVDAQLLSCNNGKIRLHKTNGVKIEVPVQKMCAADLRYIEKEIGIKLIEDKSDDIPLAHLTQGFTWYNYFKKLNLPLEACTRYAKAFENENLGESDVERLTYRKMKSLGMSEKHVRRVQRFIETNVPEPPSDDERPKGGISTGKKKVKKSVTFGATSVIQDDYVGYDDDYNPAEIQRQISTDEEYARQLQQQEEADSYSNQHHANGGLHRRGTGRPTPARTAPKDVNSSAFSQFNISSEPLKPTPAPVSPQPPLAAAHPPIATTATPSNVPVSVPKSGFEDDAWVPHGTNSSFTTSTPISHINPVQFNNNNNNQLAQPPTQSVGQPLTLEQVNNTRPVPQIPGRQRPTPQSSQQNLVDPQLLAKWKGSPSLAAANTRPVPPPPAQNMSSNASFSNQVSSSPSNPVNVPNVGAFAQQSQQHGGSGFFSSPANMSPATHTMQNHGIASSSSQTMSPANISLQSTLRPALVPNSASPLSHQSTGLHSQIQQQPADFGNQINNNSGFGTPTVFNNSQVQQPTGFNPQYQQPTGFGAAGPQVQQPTGFGVQPQITGYSPQVHQATGFNNVQQGISAQQTGITVSAFVPQSTGSSMNSTWSNATPDNPFGINTQNPNMMQNPMNYQQNIPTGANTNDKYSVFKTVDANAPSVFNSNSQNNGAFQQGNYTNQQGRW